MMFFLNRFIFRVLFVAVFGVAVVVTSSSCFAGRGDAGEAAGQFLKLDPSAASAAMGSAYTARADDALSIYFNPAGLAKLEKVHGFLSYNDIFADIGHTFVAYARPVQGRYKGGIGFALSMLDYGTQDRTRINGNNPVSNLGSFGADDMAFLVSYGRQLTEGWNGGITVKYVKETLAQYQDETFAADFGLKYWTEGWTFGMTYRNLGGKLKFVTTSDPLPRVFNAGLYHSRPLRDGRDILNLGFDVGVPNDGATYISLGAEYILRKKFIVRAGYNGQSDADNGLTVGVGLRAATFQLDYAFIPYGELGDQHRITLNFKKF